MKKEHYASGPLAQQNEQVTPNGAHGSTDQKGDVYCISGPADRWERTDIVQQVCRPLAMPEEEGWGYAQYFHCNGGRKTSSMKPPKRSATRR
ncbi:MAG TPA: hypothetical protein VK907_14705 [Phnomibacter sp.]|nr:hypothetical protein [Phnomibacter sp.]